CGAPEYLECDQQDDHLRHARYRRSDQSRGSRHSVLAASRPNSTHASDQHRASERRATRADVSRVQRRIRRAVGCADARGPEPDPMTAEGYAGSIASVGEILQREGNKRARREVIKRNISRFVLVAALLAVWELSSGTLIHPFFVSSPSAVVARLGQWAMNGDLLPHLAVTAYE